MADYARAIMDGLKGEVGSVQVTETDVRRVAGILESVEAGTLTLPQSPDFKAWAQRVTGPIEAMGEPTSAIVQACTLVALYGLYLDKEFFRKLVSEAGDAVAKVLRAGGPELVKVIKALLTQE